MIAAGSVWPRPISHPRHPPPPPASPTPPPSSAHTSPFSHRCEDRDSVASLSDNNKQNPGQTAERLPQNWPI